MEHLAVLTKRDQQTVVDQVDRQLLHQPTIPTRNRKKLRPNLLADWELRIGNLRVYYLVREPPIRVVSIVAVGRKVGNRVFIEEDEVTL